MCIRDSCRATLDQLPTPLDPSSTMTAGRRASIGPRVGKLLGNWRGDPTEMETLKAKLDAQESQHANLKTAFEEEVKLMRARMGDGSGAPSQDEYIRLEKERDALKKELAMVDADNQILHTAAAHSNAEAKGWELRYDQLLEGMKGNQHQAAELKAASQQAILAAEKKAQEAKEGTKKSEARCCQLEAELAELGAIAEALEKERDLACQRAGFKVTQASWLLSCVRRSPSVSAAVQWTRSWHSPRPTNTCLLYTSPSPRDS
eukprot:TRINITY_DN15401_c0_g1_i5.p1 TRINITY_DN15401_c0_g1~~TRINITY_DN15401_c0_g1_i5.p1  ORF type:complete len:261 (-),score=79.89 TRINITY_DN15401_c0_g1_i5:108-890(-)